VKRLVGLFSARGASTRGFLFALSGALAMYIGYFAIPSIPAGHLIINWGYYYILCVFSVFLFYARRLALSRPGVWKEWLRRPGAAGLAIAGGTLFAVWSDSFQHKILYDEFVIQGTAYEMHLTKLVSTIVRAYKVSGTWLPIDPFLDKRPYFFPFLLSLLHDLTGFRVANIFVLNVACAASLLCFLYWFARQLAGRGPAIFAVALMALMPLFGQNATGAGMDLHNLAMIALVACLGVLYLRVPSDDRLSLFVLGAVLLTMSRYESVIFIVPVAFVVLTGWLRSGRAILPWPAILAPMLLIPLAWHLRVFAATPVFFQLKEGQKSAFGWSNIAGNFRGDTAFLFNTGPALANSWYLSAIGVAGLAWALFRGWKWLRTRPRPELPAATVVGIAFGAGVAGHFVVLLFYWWAMFNDLMAARFALPMCLAFAVLGAALVKGLSDRRMPALRIAWAGLAVWLLAGGLPAIDQGVYTSENLGMQELDWEHGIIDAQPGPVLVISNKSTIPFILWHIQAILNQAAATKGDDIRYHMGQDTFSEVIVTQAIRPSSAEGEMGVDPDDLLPPNFHLQKFAEKRFGGRLDRLSRIVSIDPEPEKPEAPKKDDHLPLDPTPLRSISELQSPSDPPVAALTSSALSR
jgi:dolichyl-phosphate-mannose-protein mannosyltransferase